MTIERSPMPMGTAARVTDMHACPMFTGPVPHVGGPIVGPGAPTVLIGGLPAATMGDSCVRGSTGQYHHGQYDGVNRWKAGCPHGRPDIPWGDHRDRLPNGHHRPVSYTHL